MAEPGGEEPIPPGQEDLGGADPAVTELADAPIRAGADALPGDGLDDLLAAVARIPLSDPDGARILKLERGARIGRFEVQGRLGRGGFGVVFEAVDTTLGRAVALKILAPSRAEARPLPPLVELFRREAETAARLNHPNIVTLHDFGEWRGHPYLVLERLEGETLRDVLGRRPVPAAQALAWMIDIARGLEYAHAQGVIHRDLKPSNVFRTRQGTIKVLDFGIAGVVGALRADAGSPTDSVSGTGPTGGTPAYMAPEQWRGEPQDERTDLFAAGVLLHELVSGALPYATPESRRDARPATVLGASASPAMPKSVPHALARVIARAIAPKQGDRFANAGELLAALEGAHRRIVEMPRRRRRRGRSLVAVAAIACFVVLAGVSVKRAADEREAVRARQARVARIFDAASNASDPRLAALLLAELKGEPEPKGGVELALRVSERVIPEAVLRGPTAPITAIALSGDDKRVVAADRDGNAHVWSIDGRGARVHLRGERVALRCVAASADGRFVAAGAEDGTVRVWRSDGASPAMVLKGHTALVRDVAFAPKGAWLVSASADGTSRVWNPDGGGREVVLRGGLRARFTPDGTGVVTVSERGRVRAYSADGTKRLYETSAHGPTRAAAISDDARLAALGGVDGTTRIIGARAPTKPVVFKGHDGPVRDLAFSRDGARLATASDDRSARFGSAHFASPPLVLRGHLRSVRSVAVSPDAKRVVTASEDGTARLWRVDRGGRSVPLDGHRGWVVVVRFTSDGKRIVTASADGTLRVWPARGPANPMVFGEPEGPISRGGSTFPHSVWTARFSPDGKHVVTAHGSGHVRVWRADGKGQPIEVAEHDDEVTDARFSPDGRLVASGSRDGKVRVSSADGRGPSVTLMGHTRRIMKIAWSPDGRRIVTGSRDSSARIWRADGALGSITLRGHEGTVWDVRFGPSGREVLTASSDRTIRLWHERDGFRAARVFGGHAGTVRSARLTPGGASIMSASQDGTARVWPLDGRRPTILRGHSSPIWSVDCQQDGARFVTAAEDGSVRFWRADGAPEPLVLRVPPAMIPMARFTDGARTVAVAGGDGRVMLFDAQTGATRRVLLGHMGMITSLVIDPAGKRVVTASHDGSARVGSLAAPSPPVELTTEGSRSPSGAPVYLETAFAPGPGAVVGTALDGAVSIWRLSDGVRTHHFVGHTDRVTNLAMSPDGRWLATASLDRTGRIWPLDASDAPKVLAGHAHWVNMVSFDAQGRRIVTASSDATARIWSPWDSRPAIVLRGHADAIMEASFSRDATRVLTASMDGTARVWSTRDGRTERAFRANGARILSTAFSPDGRRVATGSASGGVHVWDLESDRPPTRLVGHASAVLGVLFARDGARALTASVDRTARVWPLDAPSRVQVLQGHEEMIWAARFSPDETRVATASQDGTVRVWSLLSSPHAVVLRGLRAAFTHAVFDATGTRVAAAAGDGSVFVWNVGWEPLLGTLRASILNCLAPEERKQHLQEDEAAAARNHAACERAPR
jgi:WD40 repeat protein